MFMSAGEDLEGQHPFIQYEFEKEPRKGCFRQKCQMLLKRKDAAMSEKKHEVQTKNGLVC